MNQADVIREFNYEPETGALTWASSGKGRKGGAGSPALTSRDKDGYYRGKFMQTDVRKARLIWLYMTGEWPETVDHINGDVTDDRWVNLRNVCATEQNRNRRFNKKTEGISGVYWHVHRCRYIANIMAAGMTKHLGYFDCADDAAKARKAAEVAYGFHTNHGEKT